MDIERYLDLVDDRRELRDTPYEYIAERELRAYQAAYLKLDDHPVRNYNFSPSGGLLYTISEGGVVALWRTSPYSIDTIVEPPDPTWQCPEEGCQGIGGRIQSASARDADRGLIARLQTSLTECGGDKKQDCLLISSLTVEDEQTGLTVRGFELRERSGPLWQRQTRVDFQEDGALLVATGKTVRKFRLDLASLIQRICMMAGDQGRIEETDLYLDRTMRTLMPAIGRRTMFCASRKSVNSGAHPG